MLQVCPLLDAVSGAEQLHRQGVQSNKNDGFILDVFITTIYFEKPIVF